MIATSSVASSELTIRSGNSDLTFDRQELEAFPQNVIFTHSPYFAGQRQFSGPTLERLISAFGLTGEDTISLEALNGYKASGSIAEILTLNPIVATRMNNKPMSVRDRGPYWVILPLSDRPELDNEDFHRLMVWQLREIRLEKP